MSQPKDKRQGMLQLAQLRDMVASGEIETVVGLTASIWTHTLKDRPGKLHAPEVVPLAAQALATVPTGSGHSMSRLAENSDAACHMRVDERWASSPEAYSGGSANRSRHAVRPVTHAKGSFMNSIIYIVGLVVIVVAILGFLGLR